MNDVQDKFFGLTLILIISFVVYLLAPILTPFLVGALLAYLVNPLVNKLVAYNLSRTLSVSIVFILLFLLGLLGIFLLIPFFEKQFAIFMEEIPNIINWVNITIVPWIMDNATVRDELYDPAALKEFFAENWTKAGSVINVILKYTLHSSAAIFAWTMNLLLIPVVTFYLLCDWNKMITNVRDLLPRRIEPTIVKLTTECDDVLSQFIRGQLLVMMTLAIIYTIGLGLVGLKTCLLIGITIGTLSIIPYLGVIVGLMIASISAFIQTNNFNSLLLVLVVFTVGHLIDHAFLTPKLVGNRIGLHPVAVIFAILAGGSLFGFVGVLLALPVAAMTMVWLRYLHQRYQNSQLYQR